MRRLVTGVDADGRSCVVEATEFVFQPLAPGFSVDQFFSTDQSPPPPRPPGRGESLDAALSPGHMAWTVYECQPGSEYAAHHTDTIDFDVVLRGSVDLILDDGVHRLNAGDCAVIAGVDHAWRSGPDGYCISVVAIGTPAPA